MTAATLSARVAALADRPPLADASPAQLAELRACLAAAERLEDLPGKWQAAIVAAEDARPERAGGCCAGGG